MKPNKSGAVSAHSASAMSVGSSKDSRTLDSGWTRMPIAARAIYRRLALMVYDLLECQEAIAAGASRLPKPIAQQLFHLHLDTSELIERVEAMRTTLETSHPRPPQELSRPAVKRTRAIIGADVIEERKALLARVLAAGGEKQVMWANRHCLRMDDLAHWRSAKGGVKPASQQDQRIRDDIAADLERLGLAPIAPTRGIGSTEKVQ